MKFTMNQIYILALIIGVAGFLVVSQSFADSRHEPATSSIEIETTSGAAAALSAANIHFDWNTSKAQVGIGYGVYEGEHGLSIGMARRIDSVLISGKLCGEKCGGIGATFRF